MNPFGRLAEWALLRPRAAVAMAAFAALIGAVAALRLSPETDPDTIVDRGSQAFEATDRFREQFGDEAVVVLVKGKLSKLLETNDLGTLLALEGCLGGNAPGGQIFNDRPAPESCVGLAEFQPAKVVYGPATFLNEAVNRATELISAQASEALEQVQQTAAEVREEALEQGASEEEANAQAQAAAQALQQQIFSQFTELAERYGQTGLPRLEDPNFVRAVVFDSSQKGNVPKARFSSFFPAENAALITVRLRNDLSSADRLEAISLIEQATGDQAFGLRNGQYLVSGIPVVTEALADRLAGELALLLTLAVLLMAITLGAALRGTGRFLPLVAALASAGVVFGVSSLVGGSLSLAALAVLPVMVGLAVDYAIQLHARFREALETGLAPDRAAVAAAETWGPPLGIAALATAIGFAALLLAPIEIVRTFGLLLLAGIAVGLLLALTSGLAALALLTEAHRARAADPSSAGGAATRLDHLGARAGEFGSELGTRFASLSAHFATLGRATLGTAITRPRAVIAAGFVLAIAGWALQPQLEVESDVRALVQSDLPEIRAVDELERLTGVGGELDIAVSGSGVTTPETIAWMGDVKAELLELAEYDESVPCRAGDSTLCPAAALPDLFGEGKPSPGEIRQILDAVPQYFSQAVLTPPGAPGDPTAALVFGLKQIPLAEQKELVDEIRSVLDGEGQSGPPPEGIEAQAVGLAVLAADANAALADARHWLPAVGLLAVILVLAFIRREPRRVIGPIVPVLFATGWSSLLLFAIGIPLNPMSATLGALVVAIGTEFAVILEARFREERAQGISVGESLRATFSRTGRAVFASGATAIAGFGVLAFSGIEMLSEFGLVTVIDLTVVLIGVMVVLPAALVALEPDA